MSKFKRPQFNEGDVDLVLNEIRKNLVKAIKKHGSDVALSAHETLGDVTEEFHELIDAVRSNKLKDIKDELLDVAVACIYGLASIEYCESREDLL